MKHKGKQLTALVLALAMCFSLLTTAWAADVSGGYTDDASVVEAETEEDVSVAEDKAEVETAEEPVEEEVTEEESAEDEGDATVSAQATSGTCGTNLTWKYSSGTLTISGTGAMYDYGDDASPGWENYYSNITKVVVEDGVTSIGTYAFGFSGKGTYFSLETVCLPASVVSIGEGAFAWDDAYFDPFVVYYDGTTQAWANISISYAGKLNGLRFATVYCSNGTVQGEDPSDYYDEDENECGDNVYWKMDTDTGVLTIFGTGAIKDYAFYTFPHVIVTVVIEDGVTSIGWHAFDGCDSLTSVTIPDSVTFIDSSAFYKCTGLTNVTIGNGVTSIGSWAFYRCDSLTSVTIPDSVTSIGEDAFENCDSLTSVTIGNGVTSIGKYAFAYCDSLTSVTMGSGVTSIGKYAFDGCDSLTSITVDEENNTYSSLDGVLFNKDQTELICYPGGKSGEYVIPDSVTSIGDGAFMGCTGLTSVTIPDSVTSIGDSAFSNCTELTSVTMGNGVTSIGSYAFYDCDSLSSITIGNGVTSIGNYAFFGCTSLTSVTIPDSVTSIGNYAFCECTGLTSVTIGSGVTTIGKGAFEDCTSLTSVTIPDSVTSIGSYAFEDCTSLTSVTIPDSVTSIGSFAFYSCTNLTDVYYTGSEEDWAAISIGSYNTYLTNATIHYNYDPSAIIDLSTCTVTLSATSYTYNGSAKKPTVTVKDADGNPLTENTDYTVEYTDNTNAGTGTVTVTGMGNYTGTAAATFTIAKAGQTVTASAGSSSIYAGKTTTVTASGKGTITYSSSNTSVATVSSKGVVTGKKPGTVTITVKAAGNSNYKSASKTVKITVKLNKTTISSLTNTSSGITVKWSKVTGASGYYIYRNGTQVKKITSGSTVSYTDTGAKTNGTKYQYKIYAYYGSTKSAVSATKTTYYVSRPTISSLKNSSSKKMTVKWGKNSKATGYQIQYSTSSSFASGNKTVTVTSYKTVSKTISSLTKGKTYYVRVRAYKTVSGTKYYSAWSSSKKVKISK